MPWKLPMRAEPGDVGDNTSKIHPAVRNVGYATAIRYFGWGFAELLIPIFIFSFVNNYTETGLVSSAYNISAVLVLPLISSVADRWGMKKILKISLFLYPLLALSYFFAWIWQVTFFLILAKWINGISFSLYAVGEKTVARTYASNSVGSNIGFMESMANMVWITAALIGVVRINMTWIPSYYLLLLIAPTSLIGLYFIDRLPTKKITHEKGSQAYHYQDIRRNLKNLPSKLKTYGWIYTVRSAFSSLLWLVMPLYIYFDTNNIYLVVISGVIMSIPSLFSYQLGKIADKQGTSALWKAFILVGLLFLSFVIIPWYPAKLLILFVLAMLFVFLSLMLDGLSNSLVKPTEYGKVEATFEIFAQIGAVVWPVVGGFFLDNFGIMDLMLIVGICSVAVSIYYYHKANYLHE